ncbi:hypothetical protein SRHO_G00024780 [Serrasalmus rhombeus]
MRCVTSDCSGREARIFSKGAELIGRWVLGEVAFGSTFTPSLLLNRLKKKDRGKVSIFYLHTLSIFSQSTL